MVLTCSTIQLAEFFEQIGQICGRDSDSGIRNMDDKELLVGDIGSLYFYLTPPRELHGILDKVDQDLLDPSFISKQTRQYVFLSLLVIQKHVLIIIISVARRTKIFDYTRLQFDPTIFSLRSKDGMYQLEQLVRIKLLFLPN